MCWFFCDPEGSHFPSTPSVYRRARSENHNDHRDRCSSGWTTEVVQSEDSNRASRLHTNWTETINAPPTQIRFSRRINRFSRASLQPLNGHLADPCTRISKSARTLKPSTFQCSAQHEPRLLRVLVTSAIRRLLSILPRSRDEVTRHPIPLNSPRREVDRDRLQLVYSSTKTSPNGGNPPRYANSHSFLHRHECRCFWGWSPDTRSFSRYRQNVRSIARQPNPRRFLLKWLSPPKVAPFFSRKRSQTPLVGSMNSRSSAWTRFLPSLPSRPRGCMSSIGSWEVWSFPNESGKCRFSSLEPRKRGWNSRSMSADALRRAHRQPLVSPTDGFPPP